MKFQITIEEYGELSEDVKKLYKEKDGKYELQVDGMVSKAELAQFRDNNIELKQAMEALEVKYKGVDMDEYAKMLDEATKAADKILLDDEGVEALVAKRIDQLTRDYDNKIETLEKDRDTYKVEVGSLGERLSKELIDSKITTAIMSKELGSFRNEHLIDALNRGREVWKLVEGEPAPYDSNGGIRYGKDGKSQMTFDEWAEELSQTTPNFWEASLGSDSAGSKKKSSTTSDREYLAGLNPIERIRESRRLEAEGAKN